MYDVSGYIEAVEMYACIMSVEEIRDGWIADHWVENDISILSL